jgi:fluoroquinolone transport system ATP-binding protein
VKSLNTIVVEQVNYTYPSRKKRVLQDISFFVKQGEIFGLLGPSGAGKSTLQKMMIGLVKGFQGKIDVLGYSLHNPPSAYYEQIGVGFELPALYSKLTARENLRFFRSLYQGMTLDEEQLLKKVGLETAADQKVRDFSKGMKMRLNLCRALIHKPEILFLDEPTSGLDPVYAAQMKKIIQDQKQNGTTVLLTTHNMTLAEQICDRVGFILNGRLISVGHPADLRAALARGDVHYWVKGEEEKRVVSLKRLAKDERFLQALQHNNVTSIKTVEPTLEDAFIHIVTQDGGQGG